MSERLNFSIDGEFLTNVARDWFWNMNKPYKKCEELLFSCMEGGDKEEKRRVCQDIIEGRKKLVGINEFELVDDNTKVRPLGQKVEELQRKMLVSQIREDMIVHPLKYIDRFAMTASRTMLLAMQVTPMPLTMVRGCSTVLTLWQNSTANRYPNKSLLLISIRPVFGQNSRTGLMRI